MKHFLPATQSYSPPKCFRLNKSERKNGPPTILVTIPIGSSAGETIVLDIISAPSKMLPPKKILPKITFRLSGPKISLHRWGTTNPTNPIKPVRATQVPTIMQTKTTINTFICSTFTPNNIASDSPSNIAFIDLESPKAIKTGQNERTKT